MAALPIIEVSGVSKHYRLGEVGATTLRESFSNLFSRRRPEPAAVEAPAASSRVRGGQFHALEDIGFTVPAGQVLGIIGANGAGKSTLLKILSKITRPTRGSVTLRGRCASLLEVGTGFHPDLTGRENIFLNGAILGMTRAEIASKFDAIVAFSQVEAFVDTPVKRYSSGMYVRLAFAVAAHLEPEILIVDEVLAVGDAAFQKRCLGKMREVSQDGRTILFVSHNMAAIQELTDRCLVLAGGRVAFDGLPEEAAGRYLGETRQKPATEADLETAPRDDAMGPDIGKTWRFTDIRLVHGPEGLRSLDPIRLEIGYRSEANWEDVNVSVHVVDANGTRLISCRSSDAGPGPDSRAGRRGRIVVEIAQPYLPPGTYSFRINAVSGLHLFIEFLSEALTFEVLPSPKNDYLTLHLKGQGLRLPSRWEVS